MNSKNAWQELFENFKVPSKCVNGSIALKQIYLRWVIVSVSLCMRVCVWLVLCAIVSIGVERTAFDQGLTTPRRPTEWARATVPSPPISIHWRRRETLTWCARSRGNSRPVVGQCRDPESVLQVPGPVGESPFPRRGGRSRQRWRRGE